MLEAALTDQILGAFFGVYRDLGFGFLEAVYVNALTVDLQARGIDSRREVAIEVVYCGVRVGFYRADLVVENRVLLEVKSTRTIVEADERQLQNYLKASHIEVGLLLHFGPEPKFRRFVFSNNRKQ